MTSALFDTEPLTGVPPIGAGARATLTWDDGSRHAVYGRTVFGRDPQREPGAEAVVLRDETLTVSRTHFELVPDERGAVVIVDRQATNGVVVHRGDTVIAVAAGQEVALRSGDRIHLGDRSMIVQIARPQGRAW